MGCLEQRGADKEADEEPQHGGHRGRLVARGAQEGVTCAGGLEGLADDASNVATMLS